MCPSVQAGASLPDGDQLTRPAVALIVVNFNAGDALADSLASASSDDASWEIVVVDNASTDDSLQTLAARVPGARIIRNAENVGFGRGVNQGVRATRAPWVLLLNPDCTLQAGAVGRLLEVFNEDPHCAVAGPKILDTDGGVQGSARGDPDMLTGAFGRTALLQRLARGSSQARRNVVTPESVHGASAVVDWVSGACCLARRDALERVGGFDERYFLYWEDADLCRRLRAEGFTIRYAPAAVAVHQVGRSSRTARARSIRAFHASAYLYYATHVAPGTWNPKRWLARGLLTLRCRLKLLAAPPSDSAGR